MRTIQQLAGAAMLLLLMMWGCQKSDILTDYSSADPYGKKEVPTEVAGNNLSFPVIWSDGVTKTLRGTYGTTNFKGDYFRVDGERWYVQDDPDNDWQAQSANAVSEGHGTVNVSAIDWGDNLEAKSWSYGSRVRVETVLYKTLGTPMTGYTMKVEDETVSGPAEVWGTNGSTYQSTEANVYSGMARLVIQKLTKTREDQSLNVTWNATLGIWEGDVEAPEFEGGVWEGIDGPGGYSAEINVQGKVIYGFNWVTRTMASGPADYRLTFVLDPNSPVTNQNTDFDANTIIAGGAEEEVEPLAEGEETDTGGGVAVVDHQNNLTYIDVRLTPKNGGSGPGNGNGGNGGNSGNGGNGGNGGSGSHPH